MKPEVRKGRLKIEFLIVIVFSLLAFSNCNKDNESSADIITSKTWKPGIVDQNPSSNPPGDVSYLIVRACDKDDTYKFGTDGNVKINRHDIKCDENEIQIEYLPYSLNEETNKLIIDGISYTLLDISSSQIKYYTIVPSGSNLTRPLIILLQ